MARAGAAAAGHHLEQRRLAGAVRPDQHRDLAGREVEIDAVEETACRAPRPRLPRASYIELADEIAHAAQEQPQHHRRADRGGDDAERQLGRRGDGAGEDIGER